MRIKERRDTDHPELRPKTRRDDAKRPRETVSPTSKVSFSGILDTVPWRRNRGLIKVKLQCSYISIQTHRHSFLLASRSSLDSTLPLFFLFLVFLPFLSHPPSILDFFLFFSYLQGPQFIWSTVLSSRRSLGFLFESSIRSHFLPLRTWPSRPCVYIAPLLIVCTPLVTLSVPRAWAQQNSSCGSRSTSIIVRQSTRVGSSAVRYTVPSTFPFAESHDAECNAGAFGRPNRASYRLAVNISPSITPASGGCSAATLASLARTTKAVKIPKIAVIKNWEGGK